MDLAITDLDLLLLRNLTCVHFSSEPRSRCVVCHCCCRETPCLRGSECGRRSPGNLGTQSGGQQAHPDTLCLSAPSLWLWQRSGLCPGYWDIRAVTLASPCLCFSGQDRLNLKLNPQHINIDLKKLPKEKTWLTGVYKKGLFSCRLLNRPSHVHEMIVNVNVR